jgi:hypothetical protein
MPARRRIRGRFLSIASLALGWLLLLSSTANAQASHRELAVGFGPTAVAVPHFGGKARGVGAQLAANYGLTSSWNLASAVSVARISGTLDENDITGRTTSVFVGPSFNVDVLKVIPYVSLMAGWQGGRIARVSDNHLALRAAIGADWRPRRQWGFGGQIEWHAALPDVTNYPSETVIWLRFVLFLDFDGI